MLKIVTIAYKLGQKLSHQEKKNQFENGRTTHIKY